MAKPDCPVLKRSEYEVDVVDLNTAYELVKFFHYAGSGSNTAVHLHGLFRKGDIFNCLGVAWWIPPTKAAEQANYPEGDWQKVLALSRLVLVDGLPQNAASFLIGQSVRRIRKEGVWECLITYADDWQGHEGTIYKATNWKYMGKTRPEDTFVDPKRGNRMVSRKAGPKTRTRAEMKALGYECLGRFAKHKFRMILRKDTKWNSSTKAVSNSPTSAAKSIACTPSQMEL